MTLEYDNLGHPATTQAVLDITVHLTATHAAHLLQADHGRAAVEQMGPAERIRALSDAVMTRAMIDTRLDDVAAIRDLLVAHHQRASYDGPTSVSSVPSVFTKPKVSPPEPPKVSGEVEPMEPVTKSK